MTTINIKTLAPRNRSVVTITAPLRRMLNDLRQYEQDCADSIAGNEETIRQIQSQNEAIATEKSAASQIAANLSGIVGE